MNSGPKGPRLSAIIPTLNEETTLADVIMRSKPFVDEVLVIDGHSMDRTAEVAKCNGARLEFDDRKGKGAAMRRAAAMARGEILVFIDADGSHVPEDIPKLVEPILTGEADHVTASRMTGGSSELHGGFDEFLRLTGSSFITACINRRYQVRLSDSQNGFRAIKRDVFFGLGLKSNSTTIEQEMIMKTLARGYRMAEMPSHEYRRKGGVSKVHVTKLWPKYAVSLIRGLLLQKKNKAALRYRVPLIKLLRHL